MTLQYLFIRRATACCLLSLLVASPSAAQTTPETTPRVDEEEKLEDTEPTPMGVRDPAMVEAPLDGGSLLDELTEEMDTTNEGWEVAEETLTPSYPRLEHHGYFRFRADYFHDAHLGIVGRTADGDTISPSTTGILPPLSNNELNSGTSNVFESQLAAEDRNGKDIAGANIRFRYSPTLHVADWLRVHSTFDILDNLVLGSTPDYASFRPDSPLVLFSGSQAPPSAGDNATMDSIRVKEAYAEIATALGTFRAGRMASHWGLGMVANGGKGLDADSGDYVDRVLLTTRLFGVYLATMMDFVGEGIVASHDEHYFGQSWDADQADDVTEAVFALFQRPMTDEDRAERHRALYERHEPVLDWGLYFVYREQDYDLSNAHQPTHAPTDAFGNATAAGTDFDEFDYIRRGGWGIIPDLWLRFQWSPSYGEYLRIEAEAAMVYGELENATGDALTDPDAQSRDLLQWGGAIEIEYQLNGNLSLHLDGGVASGDDAEYFGVLDQVNFYEETDGSVTKNAELTNFRFDRNYHVDQLLFREVIGAVTNAWYVKPGVQYDLFDSVDDALAARVDVLTAFALEKEATPGNDDFYGVEIDTTLFYEEQNRFRADILWATLIPGDALNLTEGLNQAAEGQETSDFAMTVQARLFLMF